MISSPATPAAVGRLEVRFGLTNDKVLVVPVFRRGTKPTDIGVVRKGDSTHILEIFLYNHVPGLRAIHHQQLSHILKASQLQKAIATNQDTA